MAIDARLVIDKIHLMNTHIAIIDHRLDEERPSPAESLEKIAGGDESFCEQALEKYIAKNPLLQFERGLVLKICRVIEGPTALDFERKACFKVDVEE